MAATAEHAIYAQSYREIAGNLRGISPGASGEIHWGAVVQAAQAAGHAQHSDYHPQNRNGVRDIIGRMTLPRAERDALRAALETTVNYLHGGFYRPDLIDRAQRQRHEANARYLAETLLAYCQRQTP